MEETSTHIIKLLAYDQAAGTRLMLSDKSYYKKNKNKKTVPKQHYSTQRNGIVNKDRVEPNSFSVINSSMKRALSHKLISFAYS